MVKCLSSSLLAATYWPSACPSQASGEVEDGGNPDKRVAVGNLAAQVAVNVAHLMLSEPLWRADVVRLCLLHADTTGHVYMPTLGGHGLHMPAASACCTGRTIKHGAHPNFHHHACYI